MAERTQNFYKRQLISFNPNFRIDASNPQMGLNGTDVYKLYGVTDDGETQSSISLSSGGMVEIYNDRSIQICGGTDHSGNEDDVVIIGKNGNVSITANGLVRIKASSIMLEADQDIHLKAGRNINLNSGSGRTLIQGNQIDVAAPLGSLMDELGQGFLQQVFEGSYIGLDLIADILQKNSMLTGIAGVVLNKAL